jgi:hypothetical protein
VIPIPKFGRDRPISLLSSIIKILKRVILKRLNAFISDHNVLPNYQFGFRAAHLNPHQLNRVVRHVKTGRAQGKSTGMLERAFDYVWHDALLHKLLHYQGLQNFLSTN